MKVKIKNLIAGAPVLASLYSQKLSGSLAHKVRSMMKPIAEELSNYDDVRLKLLSERGKLNEEENKFEFETPEGEKEFIKQLEELLESEVEIPDKKFNTWDIDRIPEVSSSDLDKIEWLIEE